jgi:hypothetical protein
VWTCLEVELGPGSSLSLMDPVGMVRARSWPSCCAEFPAYRRKGRRKFCISLLNGRAQLLAEFFPYFVREKLIRDLVVFNFYEKGQPLRVFIDQVFMAAEFLAYDATEQQLVDRVIMNFHPEVAAQAAFLNRPSSLKELYQLVGLVEERAAIAEERRRMHEPTRAPDRARPQPHNRPQLPTNLRCWKGNQVGHRSRDCPQRSSSTGNGPTPGGGNAPGRAS